MQWLKQFVHCKYYYTCEYLLEWDRESGMCSVFIVDLGILQLVGHIHLLAVPAWST